MTVDAAHFEPMTLSKPGEQDLNGNNNNNNMDDDPVALSTVP